MSTNLKSIGRLSQSFTPTQPISLPDLLSGRFQLLQRLVDDIYTPSQHVLLYGNRGVGKTSIARVLAFVAQEDDPNGNRSIIVSCDSQDNYSSIWRKVFQEIQLAKRATGFHQDQQPRIERFDPGDSLATPNDVRLLLMSLPNRTTIIIDEFDRVPAGGEVSRLMTDTIKLFSDSGTPSSIVLVGVSQSIEDLITAHESISRNMDYVSVDPMPPTELAQIITKGMQKAGMTFDDGLDSKIAELSQGYPHYTHLLGKCAGLKAVNDGRLHVRWDDLNAAIPLSIDRVAGGIRIEYDKATDSTQPRNLFKEVLLACALVEKDARGRFTSVAVQVPLQEILSPRTVSLSSYQRHLALFCESERGPALVKTGRRKNYRWHFANPQLVPFVYLQGVQDRLITEQNALSSSVIIQSGMAI